jgi:hypothetical protein
MPTVSWDVKTCNSADTSIPDECAVSTLLVDAVSLKMEASDSPEIFVRIYKYTNFHGDSSQKTGIFITYVYSRQDQADTFCLSEV